MEGPISFCLNEQESNLILPEHDDDDDDISVSHAVALLNSAECRSSYVLFNVQRNHSFCSAYAHTALSELCVILVLEVRLCS